MIITERVVDLEINRLEQDLKNKEMGVSKESKTSLLDKCTFIIANLQLTSPQGDIDRSSPQFKRIAIIYTRIQGIRR